LVWCWTLFQREGFKQAVAPRGSGQAIPDDVE